MSNGGVATQRRRRRATQRNAKQRNATQRNATQRNATQRNATQRNALREENEGRLATCVGRGLDVHGRCRREQLPVVALAHVGGRQVCVRHGVTRLGHAQQLALHRQLVPPRSPGHGSQLLMQRLLRHGHRFHGLRHRLLHQQRHLVVVHEELLVPEREWWAHSRAVRASRAPTKHVVQCLHTSDTQNGVLVQLGHALFHLRFTGRRIAHLPHLQGVEHLSHVAAAGLNQGVDAVGVDFQPLRMRDLGA